MKNEIIVKGLEMYASHINSLVDQAMDDKAFIETINGRIFMRSLLFNSGMAEERAHNYNIELEETFTITHDQYIQVLLDHAKIINDVLKEEVDDSVKMYLTIAYETTVEQAKAVATIAAKEFETLQNIEKRGVVEVEPVELYNADSMVQEVNKPSNEATKIYNELVNGVRAPFNFS